jgi:excisionase family DNA binding protein
VKVDLSIPSSALGELLTALPDRFTVSEVADYLGVCDKTVRRRIQRGEIRTLPRTGYWVWIPLDELLRLLREVQRPS